MAGYLFVFEGADGVGKTSIIDLLYVELKNQGFKVQKIGFPGYRKNTLGDLIYQMHNDPSKFSLKFINPCSLQLMHVAAHIDAIQREIIPALEAQTIILLDRYWWSTFIYGKLSGVDEAMLNKMIEIEKYYWRSILPNTLFLLKRTNKPLKDSIELKNWKKLQEEYKNLSSIESSKYPIIEINNEGSIEFSKTVVLVKILRDLSL